MKHAFEARSPPPQLSLSSGDIELLDDKNQEVADNESGIEEMPRNNALVIYDGKKSKQKEETSQEHDSVLIQGETGEAVKQHDAHSDYYANVLKLHSVSTAGSDVTVQTTNIKSTEYSPSPPKTDAPNPSLHIIAKHGISATQAEANRSCQSKKLSEFQSNVSSSPCVLPTSSTEEASAEKETVDSETACQNGNKNGNSSDTEAPAQSARISGISPPAAAAEAPIKDKAAAGGGDNFDSSMSKLFNDLFLL